MSAASTATLAAREAATAALAMMQGQTPKLAIVFASVGYADVERAARAVRSVVGDAQIIGGTSGGCVFAGETTAGIAACGVSVVLLGGDDFDVESRTAPLRSASLMETVPAAEAVARAADAAALRGFAHFACLVFAPGMTVDGEALVAAVRKGAGPRAQLAGGLTGDDLLLMEDPKVFFGDELRDDCVVITGLFTRSPVGIAARHGWEPVGPKRTVTRADGIYLLELDGRPALDVWVEDAVCAGATPPAGHQKELALYLLNEYELGLADGSAPRILIAGDGEQRELVARAPLAIRPDRAIQLSASISDGTHVHVLHGSRANLLRASSEAARSAVARAGGRVAGALVLACSARLAVLGDAFVEEPEGIRRIIGAPVGGACVFGEIAKTVREVDAFFNTTAVVVAFGA